MPQTEKDKEVENMEKFMTILMDVKVSVAEQNQKLDNVLDVKEKVESTYETANDADRRSVQNEKEIKDLKQDYKKKADKSDVERIVKEKDNWQRNLPAWVAVVISVVVFLSQYISIGG